MQYLPLGVYLVPLGEPLQAATHVGLLLGGLTPYAFSRYLVPRSSKMRTPGTTEFSLHTMPAFLCYIGKCQHSMEKLRYLP